jgi:phenylpyruvate tautomerase PptA (4-oxalocrotonate tautomerase family)
VPLVEITVSQGSLTSKEKLRLTKVIQRAMVEEYMAIKGRTPKSWVLVRELDPESLLIDGLTIAEIRAKGQ